MKLIIIVKLITNNTFDGDPTQTTAPIPVLCLQIIQERSFKPRETPQSCTFEVLGVGFGKSLYVQVGCVMTHSKVLQVRKKKFQAALFE